MVLLKIAARNLFRNSRRSILTMTTVFVGVMGFIVSSGLVNGVETTFTRIDIDTENAHMRIVRKGYLKEEETFPIDITLDRPLETKAAIMKAFPKAHVFSRIVFSAQLGDGVHTLMARGLVVDTDEFEKAFGFSRTGTTKKPLPAKGRYLLLGSSLAKSFEKKAGDTLTVLTRTRSGSLNAIDFKIWDVINVGNMMVDSFSVIMSSHTGRDLLKMPKGSTDLIVKLPSRHDALAAAAIASKVSAKNNPRTWLKTQQTIVELNQMRRKMMNFLIMIILLVGAAGTANTVLMSGFERKGEIGMMMAMGLPSSRVITLFAAEAGVLGLVGSVFGAIAGASFTLYFQVYGLDYSKYMDSAASGGVGMSLPSMFYFELIPSAIIVGLIIGVVVSILASLYPAWKTTRFEPREILAGS